MKALKDFSSTRLGNVSAGDHLPDDDYTRHLVERGLVEPSYQTKVVREQPDNPKPKTKKKTAKRTTKRVDNSADD